MPFVKVVFPAPRSPESRTRTGGFNCAPISRPRSIVSSEECVRNSWLGTTGLCVKVAIGFRDCTDEVSGHQRRFAELGGGNVSGESMEINAESEKTGPGI